MALTSVKKPEKSCEDIECPFHGSLRVRGRVMEGIVASSKMDKTVTVRLDYIQYVPKYKRYERRRRHIPAHNPPCVNAAEDDHVKIAECRPLSKTVSFVVLEKTKKE